MQEDCQETCAFYELGVKKACHMKAQKKIYVTNTEKLEIK